jgi:hypothetical protein
MTRGRWRASSSAIHYVNSGPALLIALSIPDDIILRGRLLYADLPRAFRLAARQASFCPLSV